jgi:hypothetical protein
MLAHNIEFGVHCSNDDDDDDYYYYYDNNNIAIFLYLDIIIPAIRMLRGCFISLQRQNVP